MKQAVFVVEDDPDISRLLKFLLESAGYLVCLFDGSAVAFEKAQQSPPALFLLDIMLPGASGLDLCKRIRSSTQMAGSRIVFVSARSGETDRVMGLELGADDYITKPFSPREVIARVKAVLRRSESASGSALLKIGDMEIDCQAMTLRVRGETRETTTTEFRVLEAFARSPGNVLSRDRLLDLIWGAGHYVHPRSVDVYISRLREKVEPDPASPRYLRTIRGVGYRLDALIDD